LDLVCGVRDSKVRQHHVFQENGMIFNIFLTMQWQLNARIGTPSAGVEIPIRDCDIRFADPFCGRHNNKATLIRKIAQSMPSGNL